MTTPGFDACAVKFSLEGIGWLFQILGCFLNRFLFTVDINGDTTVFIHVQIRFEMALCKPCFLKLFLLFLCSEVC